MTRAWLKTRWSITIPVILTAVVVFILFVPVVLDQNFTRGGTAMICDPNRCVTFVQYDSISYAYAAWGAYYQTGVNYYTIQGWLCNCPPISVNCCVPPYGGITWTMVTLILGADIVSIFLVTRRLSHS